MVQDERVLNVETLAVNAVTDIIAVCPRLNDQIMSNDKTPITDGHIDVYKSEKHSNVNLIGRVPVQVKGRTTPKKVKKSATSVPYSIDRSTLDFLRADGGGIYFYVPISPEGRVKGVFFKSLIPYRIDRMLAEMKPGQQTLSVKMDRLPESVGDVQRIVYVALEGRKQSGAKVNFGDIAEKLESITLHSIARLSDDQPTEFNLAKTDFTVTGKTLNGSTFPLDVDLIVYPGVHAPGPLGVAITCGGIKYDEPVIEHLDERASRITLSEGLLIRAFREDNGLRTNIDITAAGNLYDQQKDLSFFLAAADGSPLVIGDVEMAPTTIDPREIGDLRTAHAEISRMVEVLDSFELDDSIVRSLDISTEEKIRLLMLHTALILGEEPPIKTDGFGRMNMSIGGQQVVLLIMEGADERHRKVVDPFSPSRRGEYIFRSVGENVKGDEVVQWATVYESLQAGELEKTLNLHLGDIAGAYEALPDRDDALTAANQMVLNLLAAGDNSADSRARYLYEGVLGLVEWLVRSGGGELTYKINEWQTRYRLGLLDAEELQRVRQARRDARKSGSPDSRFHEACLAIILQDLDELDLLLDELSEEDRQKLREWPIWSLAERTSRDGGRPAG